MPYQRERQMASYMTGPSARPSSYATCLSGLGSSQGSWKAYDTYPSPSPLRRSLTTIPWSPSVYYSTAKVNSSLASDGGTLEVISDQNYVSRLDGVKVPALFSASRNSLYTRYTPRDWISHKNCISADEVRATGERMRAETARLAVELDDKIRRSKVDVGKKLGDRLQDIEFWRGELRHETEGILSETAELGKAKHALETFLKDFDNQMHIAKECLYHREKRQGIDLVHDEPEASMIAEIDLSQRIHHTVQTHLNHVNDQLNLNRAAQHELEKDSKDKHISSAIDSGAFNLSETSRGVALHKGVERVDNTISVPESWAEFTNNNVKRSQAERAASRMMRNDVQSMLNQASDRLWKQWNKVNMDLGMRVRETMEARNKIQRHLSGTLQEIFDTEKNIEFLKKAITDKVNPLKVATTRLENRLHRPNIEACRDSAQTRLVQQVHEIDESIESLNNQMGITENQLQALLRKRSALEHDLAIKNNTLFIDREKCMGMRKTYPMQQKVWRLI